MRFQKGDRVIYIGTQTPSMMGLRGIVKEQTHSNNVYVEWCDGNPHCGVYPHNLKIDDVSIIDQVLKKYDGSCER